MKRHHTIWKTARGLAALLAFLLWAFPGKRALATSMLILQSAPEQSAAVTAGDIISYTVSVGRSGETLDWTRLRVVLGDGLLLKEDSILRDCAPAIPVDRSMAGNTPISRDLIMGNNGFVLLSSALITGDTLTFDAVVLESGALSVSIETELAAATLLHTREAPKRVGETAPVHESAAEVTPDYAYAPPEAAPMEQAQRGAPSLSLRILLPTLLLTCIGGGIYLYIRLWKREGVPMKKGKALEAWYAEKTAGEGGPFTLRRGEYSATDASFLPLVGEDGIARAPEPPPHYNPAANEFSAWHDTKTSTMTGMELESLAREYKKEKSNRKAGSKRPLL